MAVVEHLGTTDFTSVTFDLYRDIHKGIRAELFDVTGLAGRVDPADRDGRTELAGRVRGAVDLLIGHAEHEDGAIQPALEAHLPALAASVAEDHERLEVRMARLVDLADDAVEATGTRQRGAAHRVYVELASFTAAYLVHQDDEERVVMPTLEAAIGVEAVVAIHGAIIGAIPPAEMAESMSLMLPAMNLDDRAEMLGGMRAGAPPEVFAGIWGLAGRVLPPPDHAALAARLGM